MQHQIMLSDEELDELDRMLQNELPDWHAEMRRSRNPGFRDDLQLRIERLEHVQKIIAAERSSQA